MTPAPKVTKPKCDGCGEFKWYTQLIVGRRLCAECFEGYKAARTEEDVTLPETLPERPDPWQYLPESHAIARFIDGEGVEVALAFAPNSAVNGELIARILAMMNGWQQ